MMAFVSSAARGLLFCTAALVLAASAWPGAAPLQPGTKKPDTAPETFNARATVASADGRGDAYITLRVERYSDKKDVDAMEKALKDGGSAAFLAAFRKAPVVGQFETGKQSYALRFTRQTPNAKGRVVTAVIEKPVYFVGGGVPGAKPREGFEVAVIQLDMDASGVGEGKLVAAAKVKPGGPNGVDIEAYESEPIKLLSVMKLLK